MDVSLSIWMSFPPIYTYRRSRYFRIFIENLNFKLFEFTVLTPFVRNRIFISKLDFLLFGSELGQNEVHLI